MPPLTLTYHTDALRCLTIGGGLSVCALSGSENCPPTPRAAKGLRQTKSAQGPPEATRHVCVPLRGADVPCRACRFPTGNEIKSL